MTTTIRDLAVRALDAKIAAIHPPHSNLGEVPAKGWLRAVREALGITQRTVADRMNVKQQPYAAFELREAKGTITLETLQRAAGALDCDLVYFLVPKKELAANFGELAARHDPALAHFQATEHSMALEGQAVGDLSDLSKKDLPPPLREQIRQH